MTSLDLGDKFYTTAVTDMTNMFNGLGSTAMTVLDLGPAFTKIASINTDFVTGTGKSGECTIYAPEAIYADQTAFKLNSTSTTTIEYTNGTINPVYKPEWEVVGTATVNKSAGTATINVKGSAYKTNTSEGVTATGITINYADNVTSTLSTGEVSVYIGTTDITSLVSPTVGTGSSSTNATSSKTEVTHTITLNNLDDVTRVTGIPYNEWSGNVILKIHGRGQATSTYSANILKDNTYGNQNMMEVDTTGTWLPIKIGGDNNTFVDIIKPEIRYEYANTQIVGVPDVANTADAEKQVIVVFDVLDKYYSGSTLSATDITLKVIDTNTTVDATKFTKTLAVKTIASQTTNATSGLIYKTNGDIYYDVDGDGTADKVGQRYELVISGLDQNNGFDYSGPMSITLSASKVTDTSSNVNDAKTITIGINETDGDTSTNEGGSQQIIDIVDPVWELADVELDSGLVKLRAKDKYYSASDLDVDDITVKVNGYVSTLISKTIISGPVQITAGQVYEYTIQLSNITMEEAGYTEFTPTNVSADGLVTPTDGFKYRTENGGFISIEIAADTITDNTGNMSEVQSFDIGNIDGTKPEIYDVQKIQDAANNKTTFIFNVTDRNYDPTDFVETDEFTLWMDNVQTDSITISSLTSKEIKAVIDGEPEKVVGHQYTLVLTDIVETNAEFVASGRDYRDLSGTLEVRFDEDAAHDMNDNPLHPDSTTISDFVDYIKPEIKYIYATSDIDKTNKKYIMTFNVTDKYYSSGVLALSDLTILMQNGQRDASGNAIIHDLKSKLPSGSITLTPTAMTTIGHRYTLTISNLEQLMIADGDTTANYSGVVTVAIPANKVVDTENNGNVAKTITSGISLHGDIESGTEVEVDVVDPIWEKTESSAYAFNPTDKTTSIGTIKVQGTDTYLNTANTDDSTLSTDEIEVYIDGTKNTSITPTISAVTVLNETRNIYGSASTETVQYGVEYTITLTGWAQNADQVKIKILEDAIKDESGNGNKDTELIIYNCLESSATETEETSGFLDGNGAGETSATTGIARNQIQKVVFVDSLAGSTAEGVKKVWDVSAVSDGSIKAWTSQTSAPYTVYIGSDDEIFANQDASYLFAYIGYAGEEEEYYTATETDTISGIGFLNTTGVTNMYYMFRYTGVTKMITLDLGSNFDTSNVTNMAGMFRKTGYEDMTTLNLGTNFDTSNVTDMNSMFAECGYKSLQNLSLRSKFYTSKVTDMNSMFMGCGYRAMTDLYLGKNFDTTSVNNMYRMFKQTGYNALASLDLSTETSATNTTQFNTEKVRNMEEMFYECGRTLMSRLNLGNNFDTGSVTNMKNMFYYCGYGKLGTLDLGDKFDTIQVTDMYGMFYRTGFTMMTKLDLGEYFDTRNVTNMYRMFYNTGGTKLTSLDLGDKFYTTNVTTMEGMFQGCGNTAMTVLDLGPAFTHIAETNTNFMTDCGTSTLVIYAPEAIYSDRTSFKINN